MRSLRFQQMLHSQQLKENNMEETLQRLAVGVFGWIATDTLQDIDLVMGIMSKGVIIALTTLSIYKLWRELNK